MIRKILYRRVIKTYPQTSRTQIVAGLVIGISYAIVLYLLLSYTIEILRYVVIERNGVPISTTQEHRFYSLFYALTSSAIGYVITLKIWSQHRIFSHHRQFSSARFAQTQQAYTIVIALSVLTAIAYKLIFYAYYSWGVTKDQFNLFQDYGYLTYLFPLVIFLAGWQTHAFRGLGKHHFGRSCLGILVSSIILHGLFHVNPERINQAVRSTFHQEHMTIQSEVSRAGEQYDIHIDESTINILRQWQGQKMEDLIWRISRAFGQDSPVSLDTILIHQITLRIGVRGTYYRNPMVWTHPEPKDMYRHFEQHGPDSDAGSELLESLNLLVIMSNQAYSHYYESLDHMDNLAQRPDIFRSRHLGSYPFPNRVMFQLRHVWEELTATYCPTMDCTGFSEPVKVAYIENRWFGM